MSAFALVALFFATGVGSGWQPMPDGSPRSDYTVQIEPETLEALADGQAISIDSEVPDEAQPIGRIRIVVGRGPLPRQRATTRRKPADYPAARGATNIELTQYTEPAEPRYAMPPAAATAGYDPYTQLPPTATESTSGAWNQDAAATNPLRDAAPPATGAGGWNGGIPAVADASAAARGSLQRVGDGIQEVTEPIRDGIDRLDDRVRTAAENLGSRTQGMIEQLRPDGGLFGGQDDSGAATTATAAGGAAAPGWNGGAPAEPTSGGLTAIPVVPATIPATGWNGGATAATATPTGGVAGPPEQPRETWNQDVPASANPGAGFAGVTPDGPVAPPLATGGTSVSRGADADPWANAADPRLRGDALGPATGGAGPVAPPAFPAAGDAPAFGGSAGPLLGSAAGAGRPAATGSTPAITGGMLAQPASRPLDGVDPMASPFTPTGSTLGTLPGVTPAGGLGGTPSPLQTAAAQGWGTGAPGEANAGQTTPADKAASGSDARHRAAVIMAWVLLSGSAAGNMYLFWSYLDVRTKYRALVRKTARAVGSRFSAA